MPGLERGGRQVFGECRQLGRHHRFGHRFDRPHSTGVLRRECHDDRGPEDPELLECLEVGLDAGPAAGVRSGDGERDPHSVSTSMARSLLTTIRDLHRRRGRERRGLALAEGIRLVEEVVAARVPVRGAAISPALEGTPRGKALKAALTGAGVPLTEVTVAELDDLADTAQPQGVVAVIEPPAWTLQDLAPDAGSVTVALDGVQDPGNVGTILRTAHALGAAGLVALPGTAELTNPKVVRGSMGSLFHLRAVETSTQEFLEWVTGKGVEVWISAADGTPLARSPSGSRARRPPVALVLGNEGAGISSAIEAVGQRRVAIALAAGSGVAQRRGRGRHSSARGSA